MYKCIVVQDLTVSYSLYSSHFLLQCGLYKIILEWHWQPMPLKLIYSYCLISFNISSKNNDFGFNSIQKINFSKNFRFKCISKQIWPWRKVGQGQQRIIIWTNLVSPTSPLLHTKSQGHQPSGSGEEDFLRFITIYGHGGHLCHVTKIFCKNFGYLIIRSLHMKFEFSWAKDLWEN